MDRWFDLTDDPNSAAALAQRTEVLRRARAAPTDNRIAYLRGLAAGRRVLDVGIADHVAGAESNHTWLHGHLAEAASECLGIDVRPDAIERLRALGYRATVCDITRETVEGPFDLVVAGEVLEHVGDPEGMFRNARAMLADGGVFVVTTPNPFAFHRVWRSLHDRWQDSVDHVAYYAPSNIVELAERTGLALRSYRGVRLKRQRTARGRFQALVRRLLVASGMSEDAGCETLIYECVVAR